MYKIVGADQKEYGPVSADQMRQWISQGRANGQTLARLDEGPWKPLSTFSEFAAELSRISSTPPPAAGPGQRTAAATGKNNPMAVAGLVLSVLGLFPCCGPIGSTLGLVFSIIGLSQIKQNLGQQAGKGLAQAGIVIAILGYVLFIIAFFTGFLKHLIALLPRL
ncbi:MAG: DUF4190 domain-containing protein [Verrucomicrobiota bacterium]